MPYFVVDAYLIEKALSLKISPIAFEGNSRMNSINSNLLIKIKFLKKSKGWMEIKLSKNDIPIMTMSCFSAHLEYL